jgi:CheY-like chemotaxis protein/anti-sigma regulatory factor (Ser/Thr protein kinase)
VHRQLQLLSRSGEQLVTLVNDILDLTRLESGRVQLESVPTDVRAIVTDVVALLQPTATEKGLALSTEVGAEVPRFLRGDPTRLRQIVTNLLANAVKFTLRGDVTLRALLRGTRLLVEIRDTGVGMSPAVQARLFKPFEQADVSYTRRFGGSGLGLTIAQRLVAQMNGSIQLRSTEGVGSTFSFEIDCVPCAAPSLEVTPARGVLVHPKHVLVVDDNSINVHVVASMLKRCGCTLVIARDGLEALAAIEHEPFDLVLMDCHMPNLDGFEATRRIRAMPGAVARTRVVAVTASALSEELAQCRAAGMDDTLTKPLTLRALQQTLERAGPSPE